MTHWGRVEPATGPDWFNARRAEYPANTTSIRVPKEDNENHAGLVGSLLHAVFLMAQLTDIPPDGLDDRFHPLFPHPDALADVAWDFLYSWDLVQFDLERQATTGGVSATRRQGIIWYDKERTRHHTQDKFDLIASKSHTPLVWPLASDRLDHLVDTKGRNAAELANRALLRDGATWRYPAAGWLRDEIDSRLTTYRDWYEKARKDSEPRLDLTMRRLEFYKERPRELTAPPCLWGHVELDAAIGTVGLHMGGFDLKTGNRETSAAIKANARAAQRLAAHYGAPVRILVLTWTAKDCKLVWSDEYLPEHADVYPHVREVRYRSGAWEHAWRRSPVAP